MSAITASHPILLISKWTAKCLYIHIIYIYICHTWTSITTCIICAACLQALDSRHLSLCGITHMACARVCAYLVLFIFYTAISLLFIVWKKSISVLSFSLCHCEEHTHSHIYLYIFKWVSVYVCVTEKSSSAKKCRSKHVSLHA